MDLDELQALIWVHTHGSLQAAARASGVARTTLRRRLARLEASLGQPACVVGPDGVRLTAAGATLVEDGPAVLRDRDRLVAQARHAHEANAELRLLVGLGGPPRMLARVVAMLTSLLPEVRLHLDFDVHPLRRLDEDFGAIVHWGDAPVRAQGFSRVLLRTPLKVQGSAAYLKRHGVPHTPSDLRQHRILHLAGTEPEWPLLEGGTVPVRPAIETTDLYVLGCMAGEGLGLGLIPARGIHVDTAVEALVPVLTDTVGGEAVVRLFVPVPTQPGSAAESLVKAMDRLAGELTALHLEP